MRVKLTTATGDNCFTDCLAISTVCSSRNGTSLPIRVQAVFIDGRAFWPTSVRTDEKVLVDMESSKRAYQLFVEREGDLYRFPLLLGVAFVGFSFWFGRRPLLP